MGAKLVPFGLSKVGGRLVDVDDVPAGLACDCICPSCSAPLIAKKGSEKQWHFAHSTNGVLENWAKECEYSYYVSLRMMAKQIIFEEAGDEMMALPGCSGRISGVRKKHTPITELFPVTKTQTVSLDNALVETEFNGSIVDFVISIKGFCLAFYFIHPGRTLPESFVGLSPDKGALITINLDGFNGNKIAGEFQSSVKSLLKEYILSGFGKQWIYHPRFQRQQESCLESIKIKCGDEVEFNGVTYLSQEYKPSTGNILDVSATLNGGSNKLAIFNCRNCGNEWQEREFGLNKCPKCDTHLYRSVIRYLC